MVDVNYLAILFCGVSSMVIGALWYGPLFSKPWMKEMGFTKSSMDASKDKGMGMSYGLMFAGSLLMAYILSHALIFAKAYLGTSGVSAGLTTGFFNWLGFVAPVTLSSVLWEGKSTKLWLINNGYNLASLLVMGVILSVF